ncbi:translational machinery component [Xylariaceae sp. FL1272]|nr:translational machinery component [Xylariaceae sp. FL1272]
MSHPTSRLLAKTSKLSSLSLISTRQPARHFSQTCLRLADPPKRGPSLLDKFPMRSPSQKSSASPAPRPAPGTKDMASISRVLVNSTIRSARNLPVEKADDDSVSDAKRLEWGPLNEPFHFHIYAHKRNTHVTVTMPNRNAIVSMSTGNLGFKKAKRGSYDAAYQLMAYVLDKLNQGNWHKNITALEVVLRGFGQGREAATKVLLGNEGRLMRPLITKVADATRLKFGGTRSPKPRRL